MEQENNTPDDIHTLLSQATEEKPESSHQPSGSGWSDLENIEPEPEPESQPEPEQGDTKGTSKERDIKARVTAQTAVQIIDGLFTGGGGFIVRKQFEKKFTPEEAGLIDQHGLDDVKEDELTDPNLLPLHRKLSRLSHKLQRKTKALPLDKNEREATYEAWYQYAKITGLDLSPGLLLISNMGGLLASRAAVILAD